MRLIQQCRKLAQYRSRLPDLRDFDILFDNCHRAALEDEKLAASRTSGEHGLAGLIGDDWKRAELLLDDGAVGDFLHGVLDGWNTRYLLSPRADRNRDARTARVVKANAATMRDCFGPRLAMNLGPADASWCDRLLPLG